MRLMLVLGMLVGSSVAWASETIIYCDNANRVVYGSVVPPHSVSVEIENIKRSEGYLANCAPAGLKTASLATRPAGHRAVIQPDGTARTEEEPTVTQWKQRHASAQTKLRALGLTDEEIDARFGK